MIQPGEPQQQTCFDEGPSSTGNVDLVLGRIVDEFIEATVAGQAPSLDSLVAQYPEYAELLRDTVPRLLSLRQVPLGNSLQDTPSRLITDANKVPPELGILGDFQLLRELGRGGMGIVYEAEQISLRRRVALKVLPFAALLDQRRLARFQQEAHAAAVLKHDNIVTVYSVGCERGVHYYAMELVNGNSLAEVLANLRATTSSTSSTDTSSIAILSTQYSSCRTHYFHSIARLLAQLARAMHYAHQLGIIHRDLKPSNLLIDQQGKPWVTDFGLAQVQNHGGLTMTGDALGTLHYMSPEQASGKTMLDERTDIYSLGVTLYELLTLRKPFEVADRQQLLNLIDDADPVSPRHHDSQIPRDLETIVLKAIARQASCRYDSAREFADDLQRFLESKPIQARRSSTLHRVVRWTQRHRLVSSLIGLLLTIVLTLAIIGPTLAVKYSRLAAAEAIARDQSVTSRQALRRILVNSLSRTITTLEDSPGTSELQRNILRDTQELCDLLIAQDPHDPQVQFQVGRANYLLGFTENLIGDSSKAQMFQENSVRILERLVQEHPANADYLLALGTSYRALIGATNDGEPSRALAAGVRGIEVLERAMAIAPNDIACGIQLDYCRHFLGQLHYSNGNYQRAENVLLTAHAAGEKRVALHPDDVECTGAWAYGGYHLARVYSDSGRLHQAEDELRACIAIDSKIPTIHTATRSRIAFADEVCDLGWVLCNLQQLDEGEMLLRQAITELERVNQDFPGTSWSSGTLEHTWGRLSATLLAQRRFEEAIAAARAAVKVSADRDGESDATSWSRYRLALTLHRTGERQESLELFQNAIPALMCPTASGDRNDLMRQAVVYATCPYEEFRDVGKALQLAQVTSNPEDGQSLRLLGIAYYRAAEWQKSKQTIEQALSRLNGGDAIDFFYLAMANSMLDEPEAARIWYQRAIEACTGPFVPARYAFPWYLPEIRSEAEQMFRDSAASPS